MIPGRPSGGQRGPLCALITVRSHRVVVLSPRFDDPAGIRQGQKPRLVQALVSESAVEALDVRVLNRLAGRDEV
jgi:hypothetical protein